MTEAQKEVLSIYAEINSLDTEAKQLNALHTWWQFLNETCSKENPCVECRCWLETKGR